MTLSEFFSENRKFALALSGGVDSACLLAAAVKAGCTVRAYTIKSQFQPDFESNRAEKLARRLGVPHKTIWADVLSDSGIASNGPDRCYLCKKKIMSLMLEEARFDGFDILADGTNASDDEKDRPGMKALRELSIISPLKECGMTKDDVRAMAKELGVPHWDAPAYACLATRIPVGTTIREAGLSKAANSEKIVGNLGFTDFRVRVHGDTALLQFKKEQLEKALSMADQFKKSLSPFFANVEIDADNPR